MRRVVAAGLVCLAAVAAAAPSASAHATLLSASPRAATNQAAGPPRVALRFSEPVEVLRAEDVAVVDARGRSVASGPPRVDAGDARVVVVPLRERLEPDSYTVRWHVIAADSHTVDDALVFGVAGARLRPPVVRPAGGLADTAAPATAARFLELAALGFLLGLIAFRVLVWEQALGGATGLSGDGRRAAALAGRRHFWRAFWVAVAAAGLAETTALAAKSAVASGTGLAGALADPGAAARLVAGSRFGELLGWRGMLLLVLAATGLVAWLRESADGEDRLPRPGRTTWLAAAGLATAVLATISMQGHAAQAPAPVLSVVADALHLGAVAVWVGGLPCLAAVLFLAPRALPEGGRSLAAAVLARFSRVALLAVGVVCATGAARLLGEVAAPAELWDSAYGRTLVAKVALLVPVAVFALRNRRAIAAIAAGGPPAATLHAVRRNVHIELAVTLAIVLAAALLVAQIPGRG